MGYKRLLIILLVATVLLLIPFVAMQFTTEVQWSMPDFVIAAILLYGTGFLCELVLHKLRSTKYRIALCAGLVIILMLIWAELALGIFGTPFSGQ